MKQKTIKKINSFKYIRGEKNIEKNKKRNTKVKFKCAKTMNS